jgi:integrase/recombinase XerD
MLNKQAKTLSDTQIKAVLKYLEGTRNGLRNRVMFMLSLHGLRAKEIASLEVSMILDSDSKLSSAIQLQNKASKGSSGRVVPMNKLLLSLLTEYLAQRNSASNFLIVTERAERFSANAVAVFFKRLYTKLGYIGCSSHSGRRTFVTVCAKKISQAGGSLRDVMQLAGHRHLQTTQRYIDQDADAQKKVVLDLYSVRG